MVKNCKKLNNYSARSKNGRKYIRKGFYCKTCGKQITETAHECFEGECGHCRLRFF